jgi:hypothetical protein
LDWDITVDALYAFNSSDFTFTGDSSNFAMSSAMFVLFGLLIIVLQLRQRRVRLWSLVLVPLLMLFVTATVVSIELNAGIVNLLAFALGFPLGIGAGLLIGLYMKVKIDKKGSMVLQGSVVAVTLWVLVLGLKLFGKALIGDLGLVSFDVLTSAMLAITLGAIIGRRIFILWKYFELKKQGSVTA